MRRSLKRATAAGLLALAAAAFPSAAGASEKPIPESILMMEPHRLRIGDYVRAWPTEQGPPVQGPVLAFSSSTLTLAGREEAALVDLPLMARLEVRRIHSHYRRAALIGAGVGLIASALLVTRELFGRKVGAWERTGWTVGLAAGGAGAGVLVARLSRQVRWDPVDLVTLKPHKAADAQNAASRRAALSTAASEGRNASSSGGE
jgi:hypothetical protein